MARKRKNEDSDPALKELRQIKTLLILLLIKQGATSDEINAGLHVNVRDFLPMKKFKKGILVKIESA